MVHPFALSTGVWDPSHRFETSWILPPYLLATVRLLIGLYSLITLLFNIGYQCTHPELGGCQASGNSFSYFTVLTYWGLSFYFLFAAVHTFTYARSNSALLDRWPRLLQALHSLYYSSITTFPILVTVVYWVLLYGTLYNGRGFPNTYTLWSNVSQHALNSAFLLFEVVFPRTAPPPWIHMLWLIVILAMYLGLAFLTAATKGFYVYPFLDPRKQGAFVAAYVFGIAVAIIVIFVLIWALIKARVWLTEKKLGMDGKFAGGRSARSEKSANSHGSHV
ncbi:FAR-17a/AIG1-like protein [Microdochium nivale]|nr:FAR-17a/AIG1-like protein [Microdochium nivale]